MNPVYLVVTAGALIAGSAVLTFLLARWCRVATLVAVVGACAGSAVGLWGVGLVLRDGTAAEIATSWAVPGGALVVGIDPLSALFLAPLFVVGPLAAIYGRSYLGERLFAPAAALNLLLAAMTLVLVARQALLFLIAWEAMTLLAYVLITFDHGNAEVRRAGWVYLVASHVAVAALFALLLLLGASTNGSLDFAAFATAGPRSAELKAALLALAVVGFGVKAGLAGLHVWLPEAHAAAPSHVSALMSAVLIKLGLYGILRTALWVEPGQWFGAGLMALGATGALLGVALALTQRDIKRVLAYSSVENIGIILLGLGLGFWSQARGYPRLAGLAFGGGLLHVWNHAAMKGLMFLGVGSIVHGTGTRDIERLGGLLTRMRWTGPALILGAVAMAGLPPLNGFTAEWILFRGFTELGLSGAKPWDLVAMAGAAALALVGGLAGLCFVRLVGIVLLGAPRSAAASAVHESPAAMTLPLWILGGGCVAAAIAAPAVVSVQVTVLEELGTLGGIEFLAAARVVAPLALTNGWLLVTTVALVLGVRWWVGRPQRTETWGCGYAAPTARMQYTGRGFADFATARALPRWFRPPLHIRPPEGPFPTAATFASENNDPLTHGTYEPLLVHAGNYFARLRFLQQGNLHIYLGYVLAAVVGGLAWVAVRDWLLP